jgi:membrane-bound serine protease (ClpP class)
LPAAAARGQGATPAIPAATPTPAAVVRLEGRIDDYTRDSFITRFNRAKATGAKVIIVDLDTYGGLVTAGLDVSRFLKSQTDVRTIAYVGDKAISAGAMIALACNEIVMAPTAQIGDCAPISVRDDGRLDTLGETERAKSESPILSEFRDSAARNGYDPLIAQAMVSMKTVVHWAQSTTGQRRFVDDAEFKTLAAGGWTDVKEAGVPVPLDADNTLLTLSGTAAVKVGLARAELWPLGALAEKRNYTVVDTFAPSGGDKVIEWLNNPIIRVILMILFAQAVWAALHAPGHGLAEALGLISLAILIGVPLLTGYAQWWEIIVILVGIALLALEIFVIPGFGFTGIAGIVLVVFGLVMTFVGKEPAGPGVFPQLPGSWVNLRTGLTAVIVAMIGSIFVSMWLRKYLPKLPYFNRLILTTTTGNLDAGAAQLGGAAEWTFQPIVGALGEAVTDLRPGGTASFYDPAIADVRVFSVISGTGYVHRGSKIVILENKDNRIIVRAETNV